MIEFNLEEEIICDFVVDKKRKKIWKIELDMLSIIDSICKKYNIRYFAIGGTLLGAIRHKGFIPWDDDIDIAMFRNDYEKFLAVAANELKKPFFLQTTISDNNYFREIARIRNSVTTGICDSYEKNGCNNGMFIDIFPLDNSNNTIFDKILFDYVCTLSGLMSVKLHFKTRKKNNLKQKLIYPFTIFFDEKKVYNHIQKIMIKRSKKESKYVYVIFRSPYVNIKKCTWNRDDFISQKYMVFENRKIPVPIGYDRILKTEYGNYMQFPPIEKRGNDHHVSVEFDPDVPYKKYIKKKYNV